jgi:hypothetical protein
MDSEMKWLLVILILSFAALFWTFYSRLEVL